MADDGFEAFGITLDCPGLDGDRVEVIAGEVIAEVSTPFLIRLTLISPSAEAVDEATMTGSDARVAIAMGNGRQRHLFGMIAEVDQDYDAYRKLFVTHLELRPRVWRLSAQARLAFHVDKSVPEAIAATLARSNLVENVDFEFRLQHTYPARSFILQYKETDLDFIMRLAEHWGICFYIVPQDDRGRIIFTDTTRNWRVGPFPEVPYVDTGERRGITRLRRISRLIPREIEIRDYDYNQAGKAWAASRSVPGGQGGKVIEYGANFEKLAEGELLAQARADALVSRANLMPGTCHQPMLAPGTVFTLTDHPRWGGRQFAVIRTHSRFRLTGYAQTIGGGATGQDIEQPAYECDFDLLDARFDYRPERRTARPAVHGVLPALTQPGPDPQYAQVDGRGRYQVRLLCGDAADQAQKYPYVRMAQPHGGPGYGFHFPLRPNVEVALTFIDGDIDRPIIMAHVPNPATPSLINSSSHTYNAIHTGGGNRIDLQDKSGQQRVKISSPHMGSVFQLGAPNAPEHGGFLGSLGALTSASATMSTQVETMANWSSMWWKYLTARTTLVAAEAWGVKYAILNIATMACQAVEAGTELAGVFKSSDSSDNNATTKGIDDAATTAENIVSVITTVCSYKDLAKTVAEYALKWGTSQTLATDADVSCQNPVALVGELVPALSMMVKGELCTVIHGGTFAYMTAPTSVVSGDTVAVLQSPVASRVWGSEFAEIASRLKTAVSSNADVKVAARAEVMVGSGPAAIKGAPLNFASFVDGTGVTVSTPTLVEIKCGDGGSSITMTPATITLRVGGNMIELGESGIRHVSDLRVSVKAPDMMMDGDSLGIVAGTTINGETAIIGATSILGDTSIEGEVNITGAMEVEGPTIDLIAGTTINGTCAVLGDATFMGMVEVV